MSVLGYMYLIEQCQGSDAGGLLPLLGVMAFLMAIIGVALYFLSR